MDESIRSKNGVTIAEEPAALSHWENYLSTFANPNERESKLFDFARNGDWEGFLSLQVSREELETKNDKGYTALMLSAYNGREKLTRVLLDKGANPDSVDFSGNSILMGASFKGNVDMVRILVQAGANIHYISPKGQTAMQMAVLFGRREVVGYLEDLSGINLQTKGGNGLGKSSVSSFIRFVNAWAQYLFSFIFSKTTQ
ncbi:ankyrin repeat domain-containing protein [Leptospira sp. 'Mane']|uniref:ankyrin repeat domain-containing protein n=1 Tax=Leptospira sp. 'Mane' TaxID=3387407 RepID=UPI00398AB841